MSYLHFDDVRRQTGQWEQQQEASGLLARAMALAMAETHLASGHDVVVPQCVARLPFIDQLAKAAASAGATCHEVYLTDSRQNVVKRFESRADDGRAAVHHDEAVRTIGGPAGPLEMHDRIEALRRERTAAASVPTRAGEEAGPTKLS